MKSTPASAPCRSRTTSPTGYPTKETVEKLYDERDFQRACLAYLWAMPIVSMAQWRHECHSVLGAGDTDVQS